MSRAVGEGKSRLHKFSPTRRLCNTVTLYLHDLRNIGGEAIDAVGSSWCTQKTSIAVCNGWGGLLSDTDWPSRAAAFFFCLAMKRSRLIAMAFLMRCGRGASGIWHASVHSKSLDALPVVTL
jgi:hypothetical protein